MSQINQIDLEQERTISFHCGIMWAIVNLKAIGDFHGAIIIANTLEMSNLEEAVLYTEVEQDKEALEWLKGLLS